MGGGSQGSGEKPQWRYPVSGLRFKIETCRIQSRRGNHNIDGPHHLMSGQSFVPYANANINKWSEPLPCFWMYVKMTNTNIVWQRHVLVFKYGLKTTLTVLHRALGTMAWYFPRLCVEEMASGYGAWLWTIE